MLRQGATDVQPLHCQLDRHCAGVLPEHDGRKLPASHHPARRSLSGPSHPLASFDLTPKRCVRRTRRRSTSRITRCRSGARTTTTSWSRSSKSTTRTTSSPAGPSLLPALGGVLEADRRSVGQAMYRLVAGRGDEQPALRVLRLIPPAHENGDCAQERHHHHLHRPSSHRSMK